MKPTIRCFSVDHLENLIEELMQDSDPVSVEKRIELLIQHYQILNFRLRYSFPIWRARSSPNSSGFKNLSELGAPTPNIVKKPGRLNEIGESRFYAAFSIQCALEEVRASDGMYVHLSGYTIERPLACGSIGDYFNIHRSGKWGQAANLFRIRRPGGS